MADTVARSKDGSVRPDFIPADRYVGPAVEQNERERLWPRIWHIAAREEEIPDVGDYVTYEILDESIIIVRTSPTEIKAFYNVCTHRGRRLVDPGSGHVAGFFCRFHGWKFGLDGQNTFVLRPEEWANCPDFTPESIALKQPRVDTWGGWVWINMDLDASPLAEWLTADLISAMEPFDLPSMRRAWHEQLIAPVNWKVVVEAFNEGYHSGATHNRFLDYYTMKSPGHVKGRNTMYFTEFPMMPNVKKEDGKWALPVSMPDFVYYQCKELYETLHSLVTDPIMRAADRLRLLPADTDLMEVFRLFYEYQKEEVEAEGATWPANLNMATAAPAGTGWHIFPNTIFLPSADGVLWYRLRPHPTDPSKCIHDIWTLRRYAPGKEPIVKTTVTDGFEAFKGRNPFLEQDFDNMLAVDRGMRSRGWVGARPNPSEEVQVSHFHKMLDEFTG